MNMPIRVCVVAVASVAITGCQTYRPKPFAQKTIIDGILADREKAPDTSNDQLSLEAATAWMDKHNPELQQIRGRYANLSALAELKSPLPNPSIELGVARAFRLSPAEASRTQPFVGLGFTVPLANKRGIADDIRVADAEAARVNIVARHRELYLELRHRYYAYAMAQTRLTEFSRLFDDAERLQDATSTLAKAGAASGLDVGLAEVELGRLELDRSRQREALRRTQSELAALLGVRTSMLKGLSTEPLTAVDLPDEDQRMELLSENQPDLARLKTKYEIAELQLRMEVAKQYPDLEIGTSGEQEPGEPTRLFGLGAALAIPLFDKNEIGIQQARNERDQLRAEFAAKAADVIGKVDAAVERAEILSDRRRTLEDRLLPIARRNRETAKQMLEAGRLDVLRFLELSRGVRELSLEILDVRGEQMDTVLELERLLGAPFAGKDI